MRILVVEDEAGQRSALIELLSLEGHSVIGAGSVRQASARLRDAAPDVVLLDLRLPDGAGVDTLRALRAECGSARFVVTTAMTVTLPFEHAPSENLAEELRRAGADAVVPKPMDFDALVRVLGKLGREVGETGFRIPQDSAHSLELVESS